MARWTEDSIANLSDDDIIEAIQLLMDQLTVENQIKVVLSIFDGDEREELLAQLAD